eukprot:CAMPEP_0175085212 /NCGR_PEP_ID=MMETSP0052_2-20121109/28528_1 /TAXON_ID=51329 ORGANISM="Polytomella parva, Strain SAG 63-3" /NCGR_SAMPLE_ID=MMETSP0052_2 /ASSEMBLY_ACC=CAM_ASM_000194 /LENGTH=1331 /DNA_ID=CAMNT_0016357179 /DNA_START=199 /DNA_END=4194 /DNA_ORIENTATION=+
MNSRQRLYDQQKLNKNASGSQEASIDSQNKKKDGEQKGKQRHRDFDMKKKLIKKFKIWRKRKKAKKNEKRLRSQCRTDSEAPFGSCEDRGSLPNNKLNEPSKQTPFSSYRCLSFKEALAIAIVSARRKRGELKRCNEGFRFQLKETDWESERKEIRENMCKVQPFTNEFKDASALQYENHTLRQLVSNLAEILGSSFEEAVKNLPSRREVVENPSNLGGYEQNNLISRPNEDSKHDTETFNQNTQSHPLEIVDVLMRICAMEEENKLHGDGGGGGKGQVTENNALRTPLHVTQTHSSLLKVRAALFDSVRRWRSSKLELYPTEFPSQNQPELRSNLSRRLVMSFLFNSVLPIFEAERGNRETKRHHLVETISVEQFEAADSSKINLNNGYPSKYTNNYYDYNEELPLERRCVSEVLNVLEKDLYNLLTAFTEPLNITISLPEGHNATATEELAEFLNLFGSYAVKHSLFSDNPFGKNKKISNTNPTNKIADFLPPSKSEPPFSLSLPKIMSSVQSLDPKLLQLVLEEILNFPFLASIVLVQMSVDMAEWATSLDDNATNESENLMEKDMENPSYCYFPPSPLGSPRTNTTTSYHAPFASSSLPSSFSKHSNEVSSTLLDVIKCNHAWIQTQKAKIDIFKEDEVIQGENEGEHEERIEFGENVYEEKINMTSENDPYQRHSFQDYPLPLLHEQLEDGATNHKRGVEDEEGFIRYLPLLKPFFNLFLAEQRRRNEERRWKKRRSNVNEINEMRDNIKNERCSSMNVEVLGLLEIPNLFQLMESIVRQLENEVLRMLASLKRIKTPVSGVEGHDIIVNERLGKEGRVVHPNFDATLVMKEEIYNNHYQDSYDDHDYLFNRGDYNNIYNHYHYQNNAPQEFEGKYVYLEEQLPFRSERGSGEYHQDYIGASNDKIVNGHLDYKYYQHNCQHYGLYELDQQQQQDEYNYHLVEHASDPNYPYIRSVDGNSFIEYGHENNQSHIVGSEIDNNYHHSYAEINASDPCIYHDSMANQHTNENNIHFIKSSPEQNPIFHPEVPLDINYHPDLINNLSFSDSTFFTLFLSALSSSAAAVLWTATAQINDVLEVDVRVLDVGRKEASTINREPDEGKLRTRTEGFDVGAIECHAWESEDKIEEKRDRNQSGRLNQLNEKDGAQGIGLDPMQVRGEQAENDDNVVREDDEAVTAAMEGREQILTSRKRLSSSHLVHFPLPISPTNPLRNEMTRRRETRTALMEESGRFLDLICCSLRRVSMAAAEAAEAAVQTTGRAGLRQDSVRQGMEEDVASATLSNGNLTTRVNSEKVMDVVGFDHCIQKLLGEIDAFVARATAEVVERY